MPPPLKGGFVTGTCFIKNRIIFECAQESGDSWDLDVQDSNSTLKCGVLVKNLDINLDNPIVKALFAIDIKLSEAVIQKEVIAHIIYCPYIEQTS